MSTPKYIIEVTPPKYEQVRETMEFRNYTCPACNGRGGFTEEVGHDQYQTKTCNYCEGTGKVKAEVTIKWRADYGDYGRK